MSGNTVKTDNAYLRDKLDMRLANLPDGDVRVLDCFSGLGVIWRTIIRERPDRKIRYLPIDKRDDLDSFHLDGQNQQFLQTLDLSKFNVIDLDAYGVPFEQLRLVFERGYHGVVFVTFIQSLYGQMPIELLRAIGFSKEMTERIPTLFGKRGWDYFREWLAINGVRQITHRSHSRKHYLVFTI